MESFIAKANQSSPLTMLYYPRGRENTVLEHAQVFTWTTQSWSKWFKI